MTIRAFRTDTHRSRARRALGACALALAASASSRAQAPPPQAAPAPSAPAERIELGSGRHRYAWVKDWARLPDGTSFGNTHGCIAIDASGRVYVNTDTENAVMVFAPDGRFLRSWGREFRGGLHGMTLVREGDVEFLLLAHTARHEVLKTTLDGEVLWTLGFPESSGLYKSADEYHPTSVALAPDGRMFVADGYGLSWVHAYDAQRRYVRSFGGPGTEPGKMQTPHGLMIDTRGPQPLLYVADRENHRLQVFDLDGKLVRMVTEELRRPCNLQTVGGDLVVADLAGRVTILDRDDKLVAHLGDNPDPAQRAQNGVPREQWVDGRFISPHCARWDAEGNLYVMDWLAQGRVTKLERLK